MSGRIYLPGLNGLRAIAAISVVVSHINLNLKEFGFAQSTHALQLAQFGVTMFFALSGFLITYLLMKEREQTGTVAVKKFYIRRILRIWPLYYFCFALVMVADLVFRFGQNYHTLPLYALMLANVPAMTEVLFPYISHYWSLGVEEQFYLMWPWMMKKSRSPEKGVLWFLVGFMAFKAAGRFLEWKFQWIWGYRFASVTRFDCLAIGALGAVYCAQQKGRVFTWAQKRGVEVVSWLLLLVFMLRIICWKNCLM